MPLQSDPLHINVSLDFLYIILKKVSLKTPFLFWTQEIKRNNPWDSK